MSRFVLSKDFTAYRSGDYVAFNNVWGKGDLVNGVDYYQTVTFDTNSVTTGITFSWSWPARASGEIYAYPSIVWGDSPLYDGADEPHDHVSAVSDLRAFAVDVDLDVTQGSQYVNLSFDMFLTNKPLGDASSMTTEVMIWLDSQVSDVWGDEVGTFTDGTRTATIYFAEGTTSWDYIAVVFDKPWLDGTVDIKQILADLGRQGLISTSDYVSGYGFGAEVAGGKGSFTINSLSTTFKTNHGPTLETPIADQTASAQSEFEFQISDSTFADIDKDDTLTYTVTLASGDAVPSWLIFDTASHTFSGTPVDGDVGLIDVKVTASDGMASVSDIFSIEVLGTDEGPDDTPDEDPEDLVLLGTDRRDILVGGDGDDILLGRRGRDFLDGGDGMDTASYKGASAAVIVSLVSPGTGRGDAKGDTFESIENILGTRFGDQLTGDDAENQLDGGRGNDQLAGGFGADVFVFGARYGRDVISDFDAQGPEYDVIDLSRAVGIDSFEDLIQDHLQETDRGLVITTDDGSRLTLAGIYATEDVTSANFLF